MSDKVECRCGGVDSSGCLLLPFFVLTVPLMGVFLGGACAEDPEDEPEGHDLRAGYTEVFQVVRDAWEATE